MTVWGMRVLASLAGTRSASSLPFHWKITILSFHSKPKENCRNPNLDQEHEFSWGICGADNPLRVKASVKATRSLVSFGSINQAIVRLAQVKQGQTRSNMAKQGQTRPNKAKQCHLFSSASWWWRCPLLQPCACCLQASLCPENERYSKIVFCNFRYWPFPSSSFQIHQWDRHSPSYPWAPRYYPEITLRVKFTNYWAEAVLQISPHRQNHATWGGTQSCHSSPPSYQSPEEKKKLKLWANQFWNLFHGEFFLHVAHVDIATKSEKGRLLTSQFWHWKALITIMPGFSQISTPHNPIYFDHRDS